MSLVSRKQIKFLLLPLYIFASNLVNNRKVLQDEWSNLSKKKFMIILMLTTCSGTPCTESFGREVKTVLKTMTRCNINK